jgi:branched-chain amino acid transport system permease protein
MSGVTAASPGSRPPPDLPQYRVARSTRMHLVVLGVSVLVVLGLASVPLWAENSVSRTLITFFVLVALAQMWNLLGGFAGLISVGQQAYMGVGAYGLWLSGDVLGLHPFVSIFVAGLLAAALALPAAPLLFRLRGGYFAIGTWVVAEVMRMIVANIQATGGGSGKTVISAAHLPIATRIQGTYWLGLLVAVGSILLVYFLLRSKVGLALTSIRDNDVAAQSSGVNVFRAKLMVFVLAAFGCGVTGAVVALNLLRIQPAAAFSINWTAYAIFIVVIGGFGTIEGPILGAIIYFSLQQTLSQYGSTYMLLLGVLAVIMATKAPRGLWGFAVKRWNLHLFPVSRRLVMETTGGVPATPAAAEAAPPAEARAVQAGTALTEAARPGAVPAGSESSPPTPA